MAMAMAMVVLTTITSLVHSIRLHVDLELCDIVNQLSTWYG